MLVGECIECKGSVRSCGNERRVEEDQASLGKQTIFYTLLAHIS